MCDICGFRYKLRELKEIIRKGKSTNLKACPECWSPDHPQLKLGEFPVDDPQAIRDPRPDRSLGDAGVNSSRQIQYGFNPVGVGRDPFFFSQLLSIQWKGKKRTVTTTTMLVLKKKKKKKQ